jgi:hypothetical protein
LKHWTQDAVVAVRAAMKVAQDTKNWTLAEKAADVVFAMKLEEQSVPPDLFAYAILMDQLVSTGALELNCSTSLEQSHHCQVFDQ